MISDKLSTNPLARDCDQAQRISVSVIHGLGPESEKALWAMQEVKAFLDPYRKYIHSLILFGSYAMGHATRFSDADFLVLLKKGEKVQRLSRFLFGIGGRHRAVPETGTPGEIQFVPFDERGIERLFELSTPLVHAARHGVIIWDDGWLKELFSRPYPRWPTREAAIVAFTKWIVWQYYRCAIDLKREIRIDHGPDGICTRSDTCEGHFSGDILARVLSRMLYVTLPERGFLPLSKREAMAMALEAYGRRAWRPVALAMAVLRNDRAISYREFEVMFPFVRSLFRECIRTCGPRTPRVVEALRHYAEVYKRLGKS
jgi:predicted nucleotidyltransferase